MEYNPFDTYTSEYEAWFKKNRSVFESELLALKQAIPANKKGLEIGVGSGIFAEKLNIKFGIDPSENMLKIARQRHLQVEHGYAEQLPYPNNCFDFTAFITSVCFINEPLKALQEAYRVTKPQGYVIVAFIDKESPLGQTLMLKKKHHRFYQTAHFYSVKEIMTFLTESKFELDEIFQTLTDLDKQQIEFPSNGFGKGGFVVIKGKKRK